MGCDAPEAVALAGADPVGPGGHQIPRAGPESGAVVVRSSFGNAPAIAAP